MTRTVFYLTTTSGMWSLRTPETLTYSDGRDIIALNLWDALFISDVGKNTESIMLSGVETDLQSLHWVDDAMDNGDEITISGFTLEGLNGVYIAESFSYNNEYPNMYSYTLTLEKT